MDLEANRNRLFREGHRAYVGSLWDQIGPLQFQFLKSEGLTPKNVFLDLGCGSLRAGVHLIRYLDAGCYLGFDAYPDPIFHGISKELGWDTYVAKRPIFACNNRMDLSDFTKRPEVGMAQSFFTHLDADECCRALDAVGAIAAPGMVLYATYVEGSGTAPCDVWKYSRKEMEEFGAESGWAMEWIGDWGHPRQQLLVQYWRSV